MGRKNNCILIEYIVLMCFLCNTSFFISCTESSKTNGYTLLIIIDSSVKVKDNAKVILNGKDVGMVKSSLLTNKGKLLVLNISNEIKIPSSSIVSYIENILGDAYVSIAYPESQGGNSFFLANDTLSIDAFKGIKRLDTISGKKIMKELIDVKNVLDSSLKQ